MERGWNAKGLLAPLWAKLKGHAKRDQLAKMTGITATTLSAYNSGNRPLGMKNARKIAAALDVSVLELGAPLAETDQAGETLRDRLEELATTLGDSLQKQAKTERRIQRLQTRVRALEAQRGGGAAAARGPR